MKEEFDYTQFIERYLQDHMGPEEKIWFEKEIEGNLSLKKEIQLRKQVEAVLYDKDLIDLKVQLDQIHKEIFEVTEKGKGAIRKIYRRVYLTASALAVFAIMLTVFMTNRNFSNEKLIGLYYQPTPASENFRSAEHAEGILTEAMKLYKSQNYTKAIPLFESILAKDINQIGVNLYSGISHMEIEQFKVASERFQRIIDGDPNPFVESANWYLGMCFLMTDKRQKASKQFDILAKSNGYYMNDAKKILKRLN